MPTIQINEFKRSRVDNLAIIKEFLNEERYHDQLYDVPSDDE